MLVTTWRDDALWKLRNRPKFLSLKKISDDTGIPYEWLKKFIRVGSIEDPSVNTVQTLLEYLNNV